MRKILALALLAACGDPALKVYPDAPPPYALTWTMQGGATGARPDITHTTTLAIVGTTLTYGGGPGGAVHMATDDAGCLAVDHVVEANGAVRDAYRICPVVGGYDGMVLWRPGGLWRVQAWR